jgi:DNA-binding GntR family transcriptional regulator
LHHQDAQAEVRDVNAEHVELMNAMLARDAVSAVALMDAHLIATEQSVARLLAAHAAIPGEKHR